MKKEILHMHTFIVLFGHIPETNNLKMRKYNQLNLNSNIYFTFMVGKIDRLNYGYIFSDI